MDWIVTFKDQQAHKIWGKDFNKNSCLFIHGDYGHAVNVAKCLFGNEFAHVLNMKSSYAYEPGKRIFVLNGWSYSDKIKITTFFVSEQSVKEITITPVYQTTVGYVTIKNFEETLTVVHVSNVEIKGEVNLPEKIWSPESLSFSWEGVGQAPEVIIKLVSGDRERGHYLSLKQL